MDAHLSKEVLDGLRRARRQALRKKNRLRLHVGDEVYPLLTVGEAGFEIEVGVAPQLRGLVDVYDGARHLLQCLIIQSELEDDILHYEFKRRTEVMSGPAKDFVVDDSAPVALLAKT